MANFVFGPQLKKVKTCKGESGSHKGVTRNFN